jgi:hypothetical protein
LRFSIAFQRSKLVECESPTQVLSDPATMLIHERQIEERADVTTPASPFIPFAGLLHISFHAQAVSERVASKVLPMNASFFGRPEQQRKGFSIIALSSYTVEKCSTEFGLIDHASPCEITVLRKPESGISDCRGR